LRGRLRGLWRLLRAGAHILAGLLTILLRFPRLSPEQREIRVQVWSRELLAHLGIRLEVRGPAALPGPLLLVANHISWLDISALHAARFCRFVSKADVKAWPLIGALASGVGTLFIQRESRRDAMRVVHHMADSLRAGDVLAVFPEGTTGDGVELLPFHANLLQAAIAAGAPVQPVALQFVDTRSGQRSSAPCYVGDDTLLGSVWRTVCAPAITVRIVFGAPQPAAERERRAWAEDLRQAIEQLRQPPGEP
jgi:1-acyl-sn-glycerol-3-phosphate acyltransferase